MHTKGPWQFVLSQYVICVLDATGSQICEHPWQEQQDIANARLIAATPELLEACEYALDILLKQPNADDMGLNPIQEAIRKAKEKYDGL